MLPLLASVLGAERNFEFSVLTCFALRFDLKRKAFQPSLPCVSAFFTLRFSLFRFVFQPVSLRVSACFVR